MNIKKYEIIDSCRKNLTKYTLKAFTSIPEIDRPLILDAGCGTGEPTLALMENCNGYFYAVDVDKPSLDRLKNKIEALNYSDRIKIINASIFDLKNFNKKFDIVLAEGLLNVAGFERGLSFLINLVKINGYLIIHDEFNNDSDKKLSFRKNNLMLLESYTLDENIWWNEYYSCLQNKINVINDDAIFKNEIKEINDIKSAPEKFRSIYYILKKS
ncbi:MAG: class I SAM-dependent methyltransferase [Spirochaetes bacterium]|nr:class I SAM-dependent methyltransferase [Spirochaetota bacterium]